MHFVDFFQELLLLILFLQGLHKGFQSIAQKIELRFPWLVSKLLEFDDLGGTGGDSAGNLRSLPEVPFYYLAAPLGIARTAVMYL